MNIFTSRYAPYLHTVFPLISACTLISTLPLISTYSQGHYFKQASPSNKPPLPPPASFLLGLTVTFLRSRDTKLHFSWWALLLIYSCYQFLWEYMEKTMMQFSAGKHTIFGRISHGISVVRRIGLVETDPGDRYAWNQSIYFSHSHT